MTTRLPCRLYLITPSQIDVRSFAPVLEAALDAGDVACLQLRLKGCTDDEILRAGETLMPLAQARGVAFIVNDRPDLAQRLGADGAHVGQDDMPYAQARAALGANRIVGVTCHDSRHLAMQAAEQGADYVAFGAFFATPTKQPKTMAAPALITWWSELFEMPCVAVGGITPENGRALVEAGADFLAVSSGVWDHAQGPAAAVREFSGIFG